MPTHEADPIPNFVIVGEVSKSMFDFPQPEENPSSQPDKGTAKNIKRDTLAPALIQYGQPHSRPDKGKGRLNISSENEANKAIKFTDAVGRKFSHPFHLCRTWAVSTL